VPPIDYALDPGQLDSVEHLGLPRAINGIKGASFGALPSVWAYRLLSLRNARPVRTAKSRPTIKATMMSMLRS